MTREEKQKAIDAVERLNALKQFIGYDKDSEIVQATQKSLDMAIKALEQTEPEKCGDCISREEIKQKFQWLEKATKYGNEDAEQQNFSYSTMMMYEIADMIEDAIDSCKSVEPERKTGKWVAEQQWCLPKCSICGASCFGLHGFDAIKTPYCPTCGAKMEVDR